MDDLDYIIKIPFRIVRDGAKKVWYALASVSFPSSTILLYHRVADVKEDPYLLAVSAKNFEDQLEYIKRTKNIITLSRLIENLKQKKLNGNDVAITFDDGYADNLSNALPILEKLRVPATIFITAGMIGPNDSFYWDKKTDAQDRGRALTLDELKKLAAHPLIEIGAHTMTHPNLATLPVEKQQQEIEGSKQQLERMLGKNIKHFAYPFGSRNSFTAKTEALAEKAGFASACATTPTRVFPWSGLFKIPRIIVRDWKQGELAEQFKYI